MGVHSIFTCDGCEAQTQVKGIWTGEAGWVRAHVNVEGRDGVLQRSFEFCPKCRPDWAKPC